MAAPSDRTQGTYFKQLEAVYKDVAKLCGLDTWLVEVVGFNYVDDQLRRYLSAMKASLQTSVKIG